MPGVGRRRNRPACSLEHPENVAFQCLPITRPSDAGAQFLSDHHAQVLEWRESLMEALKRFVSNRVAEGADEQLRIEDELMGASHRSASGELISTPSIARVPSTNSR